MHFPRDPQCFEGKASLNFSSLLGRPADPHFIPKHTPPDHSRHGFHVQDPPPGPRWKSARQREKDRARAAAHRATNVKEAETAVNDPATVDPNVENNSQESAASAEVPARPPQSSGEQEAVSAARNQKEAPHATLSTPGVAAATAVHPEPQPGAAIAATVSPLSSEPRLTPVSDEVLLEHSEIKVYAEGVFENCPDANILDEYYSSLRKFIFSEKHLENNIVSVKMAQLSSRQIGHQMFVHKVKVEILVKTARLSEPPAAYIKKHLEKNDWLKSNKTRITLTKIE